MMDLQKYRKWYLSENWGNNEFVMIKYYVEFKEIRVRKDNRIMTIDFQRNHPKVLSGEGYWITNDKLCIGYVCLKNPKIFRPIFSHKRQRLLNRIHKFTPIVDINGKKNEDEGNTICNPYKFWNKVKSKYFLTLSKNKKIPIVCIEYIFNFMYY